MGLSDGRKSFPIGLVVLIQYRSVTARQPTTQPPSHVAVAITLNALAKASSLKMAANEQVCAQQVIQEVNFPKSFLSSCIRDGLCTYIAVFVCGVRWRHNVAPNLERLFCQFRTSLRKDSVAICIDLEAVFDICYRSRCAL